MNIQSVPLSALQPPADNPRTSFNKDLLEGLAASIKTDGILQNLVVAPVKGKSKRFRVISGERRLRALKLLEKRGDIKSSFRVPVEVRDGLSKDETLRLATVENLQREDLPPLDQAAALATLVRKGTTLDDLVAQTGLSATTIRRRVALNGLCEEATAALRDGQISLAQAEAVTLGTPEAQRDLLLRISHNPDDYSANAIRESLLDDKPSVASAIFARELYTGTITTDLFQAAEESFFDDAEQFMALQRAAVEELARSHEGKAAFVDVTDSHRIPDWQYEKATKRTRKRAGVVINMSPRGVVEVREGLVQPKAIDRKTARQTASPEAVAKPKAVYPTPLRRIIAWHKSLATQEALLSHPRKAKEVLATRLLGSLKPHAALRSLPGDDGMQTPQSAIGAQCLAMARDLGLQADADAQGWDQLSGDATSEEVYALVCKLTDEQLERLLVVLAALPFGQENCDRLDAGESLFNAVAQDLALDMRNHWRPDAAFLTRRTRDQLVAIASECGLADGHSLLRSWKKSELVSGLLTHFEQSRSATTPTTAQQKARSWLPDAMRFPATGPDAEAAATEADDELADEVADDPADDEAA